MVTATAMAGSGTMDKYPPKFVTFKAEVLVYEKAASELLTAWDIMLSKSLQYINRTDVWIDGQKVRETPPFK
jgi:hypothetical protein